ncbi:MAG: prolyl oligopeptidase family serine peptidase [Chloroflexia bacterium]
MVKPRIESLLAARLFMAPQLWENRIYFISNLSGRFSLYAMDYGGSVPEPLLPPDIALQNPELVGGSSFLVFPKLGKILVSIDRDGDEIYRPMVIPLEGGFPEPAFPDLEDGRIFFDYSHNDNPIIYLVASALSEQMNRSYQADIRTGTFEKISESVWGGYPNAANDENTLAVLVDGYTSGDNVLYIWRKGEPGGRKLLYGTPLEERTAGQEVPLNALNPARVTPGDQGLVSTTALFDDAYSIGYIDLREPGEVKPVTLQGTVHSGTGEMTQLTHLHDDRYLVQYNIDGCSWAYEGTFNEEALTLDLDKVICGQGQLAGGVAEGIHYDKESDRYVLAFSTASSPTQIYSVEGEDRKTVPQTRERILGVPQDWLSNGEDASFQSYDGLRISARLYMPARSLGFDGPRPLVYYIHGGPQSQERPNFAWFSMPLIQFLTLNGFAVFVPNARGSSGYGLGYMKHVDHDWGGQDRLDHVHAMKLLKDDPRIDTSRAGVMGRSYGGYMTLTLAGRHPELWSAAIDMFGPYNLITFVERIPEPWKPYFYQSLGHPDTNRDFLVERSPSNYIHNIKSPLLVMQGANDPRVIERESRDVVEQLHAAGKEAEYMVFENEGHDVIKYENKVLCYNTITDFFKKHLKPYGV